MMYKSQLKKCMALGSRVTYRLNKLTIEQKSLTLHAIVRNICLDMFWHVETMAIENPHYLLTPKSLGTTKGQSLDFGPG